MQLSFMISSIIESMNPATNRPDDVEAAFNIALKASKLWVSEGLAAAATYFDARGKRRDDEAEDDEPFLEELNVGPGNEHQSDDDDVLEAAEDIEPDNDFPPEDVTREVEKAFESIQANAEELANQTAWMPLCDNLDNFFTQLNKMADLDDLPGFREPGVFTKQVEIMLSRPVFTREGFIGVWKTIMELHDSHVTA